MSHKDEPTTIRITTTKVSTTASLLRSLCSGKHFCVPSRQRAQLFADNRRCVVSHSVSRSSQSFGGPRTDPFWFGVYCSAWLSIHPIKCYKCRLVVRHFPLSRCSFNSFVHKLCHQFICDPKKISVDHFRGIIYNGYSFWKRVTNGSFSQGARYD